MLNNLQLMLLKLLQKEKLKKKAEATGDLIDNKIASIVAKSYNVKIVGVSKHPQPHDSETVTNEHNKEIPKERYKSPEEK